MSHRQVLYNTDKDLLLNVPLNDEQEVRRQWGTPSGAVAFEYGYVSFTTDGKIELSQPVYGINSVRLVVYIDTTTEDVIQLSSTHSVSISAGTVTATGFSTPTIYVDGVATSTVTAGKAEIIITTATSFKADNIVLGYISSYFEGKIYEVQLYNIVLDSSSVINLYNDARYPMPHLEHSEKLGEDVLYGFDFTDGWLTFSATINDSNTFTTSGANGYIRKLALGLTVGRRYKLILDVDSSPVSNVKVQPYNGSATYASGSGTHIFTAIDTGLLIFDNTVGGNTINVNTLQITEILIEQTSKILHVNAQDGVCRNLLSGDTIGGSLVPDVVNTDIEVVRDSPGYVPRFNGSTSKIDLGDYNSLVGDITVLGWSRFDTGMSSYKKILSNSQLLVQYRSTPHRLYITNNASTAIYTADDSVSPEEWFFYTIKRKADGKTTWYINGELSGTEDQVGGTPVTGSGNIYIGTISNSDYWDGQIPETIILSGLLTVEEISQVWTSQKHLYGH